MRRLLYNERLTQDKHYQPVAKHALHGLKGQRVQLLIDRRDSVVYLNDVYMTEDRNGPVSVMARGIKMMTASRWCEA